MLSSFSSNSITSSGRVRVYEKMAASRSSSSFEGSSFSMEGFSAAPGSSGWMQDSTSPEFESGSSESAGAGLEIVVQKSLEAALVASDQVPEEEHEKGSFEADERGRPVGSSAQRASR